MRECRATYWGLKCRMRVCTVTRSFHKSPPAWGLWGHGLPLCVTGAVHCAISTLGGFRSRIQKDPCFCPLLENVIKDLFGTIVFSLSRSPSPEPITPCIFLPNHRRSPSRDASTVPGYTFPQSFGLRG